MTKVNLNMQTAKTSTIYATPSNIEFLPPPATAINKKSDLRTRIRHALRQLFSGVDKKWKHTFNYRLIKAVIFKGDPKLYAIVREEIQAGLLHVHQQLINSNLNELQHKQIQLFLANVLDYVSMTDPTPFESLKIPQWINNNWVLVDYQITPIELSSPKSLDRYSHRFFAYGLEPINNDAAQAHLVFPGTNFLGQGYGYAMLTDCEPFTTVGEYLYRKGKNRINEWLESQKSRPIQTCGISLGGALALLLATDQPEKINRVIALSPPGLFPFRIYKNMDHWKQAKQKPEVIIQKQKDDIIPESGVWKPEWTILRVTPDKHFRGPRNAAHYIPYAGQPNVSIHKVDTKKDNKKASRRLTNFFMYGVARTIVYLLMIVPWMYFFRPIGSFFSRKFNKRHNKGIHDASAPRNEAMNISKVIQEKEISYADLATYYNVQRQLLANKPRNLDANAKTSIEFIGTDKQSLLNNTAPATVRIRTNNAKLYHIEKTLFACKQYTDDPKKLQQETLKLKQQYKARKHA